VQAANPKALVFFVALLPQFVNPESLVGLQILILGVSSVLIEFFVLGAYVLLVARAGAHLAGSIERIGGGRTVTLRPISAVTSDRLDNRSCRKRQNYWTLPLAEAGFRSSEQCRFSKRYISR
jgi:hypothetical protein